MTVSPIFDRVQDLTDFAGTPADREAVVYDAASGKFIPAGGRSVKSLGVALRRSGGLLARGEVVISCERYTGGYTLNNNATTGNQATYEFTLDVIQPCADISFVFAGWYRYLVAPNAVSIRIGVRYPAATDASGTFAPLYFGGVRDVTIQPGQYVQSDPLWGYEFAAGTRINLRVQVTVASGNWPIEYFSTAAYYGTTDLTTSGSVVTTGGGAQTGGYGPVACLGVPTSPGSLPTVCLYGDSVMAGSGEPTNEFRGFALRAINKTLPYLRLSASGEVAQNFATDRNRPVASTGAHYAVIEHGTNDVNAGRTLAQIQADLQTAWDRASRRGCRVIQATVTPKTTTTDGWSTTANQTFASAAFNATGIRSQLNDWIRTQPSPLWDVWDVAAVIESGTDTGLWGVGAAVTSGTVTSGTTSSVTVTGAGWTANAYVGKTVVILRAGVYLGAAQIWQNTATVLSLNTTISAPTSGDTYTIIDVYTADGTHPSGVGHALMAARPLQESGLLLNQLPVW